jgi:hypothetical protein
MIKNGCRSVRIMRQSVTCVSNAVVQNSPGESENHKIRFKIAGNQVEIQTRYL